MWAPPAGPGRRARATTHECGAPPRTPPTVTPGASILRVLVGLYVYSSVSPSCFWTSLLTPTTVVSSGTSLVTIAEAPTVQPSPTVTSPSTVELAPGWG